MRRIGNDDIIRDPEQTIWTWGDGKESAVTGRGGGLQGFVALARQQRDKDAVVRAGSLLCPLLCSCDGSFRFPSGLEAVYQ